MSIVIIDIERNPNVTLELCELFMASLPNGRLGHDPEFHEEVDRAPKNL